jgi:hypothetical protein
MPACTLTWYQGQQEKPPHYKDGRVPAEYKDGILFVGDKGMVVGNHGKHTLLDESIQRPEQTIPKSIGHHAEVDQRRQDRPQDDLPLRLLGPADEANHLGSIAYRLGKKLEWDAANLKCTNAPEATVSPSRIPQRWELKA